MLTKAQVLTTMLSTNMVDPLDCYKSCGLFTDPSAAYLHGMKYMESRAKEQEEKNQLDGTPQYATDHDGDGIVGENNHGRRS